MHTSQKVVKTLASLILMAGLLVPVFAQAQDAIGRVILASGVVTAVNAVGNERRIARGSEVFVDETITTGPNGSAQLRFTDGAVVSLELDSFFTVNEYEYDGEGGASDTMIMTMARGTMRTLTGVIGDDPTDTYELNTPFASVGVRGTEYAVVVDTTGRVRVFVFDGSVAVSAPTGGSLPAIVGVGGDSDAVTVNTDATITEVDLADVPAEIRVIVQNMTADPVSDDEVASLPAAEMAVEVQRSLDQRQDAENQQQQQENNPGDANAAGNLVDANGRVQFVASADDIIDARTVVVISVSESNPNAFDARVTDVIAASPN